MKRKLLFALISLMIGGGNLWAQTDVTSTYIQNADFEGDYQRFLDINSDRGVEKPVGWSVEWSQTATNDQNGMTYVGSMNQDGQNWTAHGGSKAYFTRMRWANATLNLRQTMSNLRPGSYTLSFYATAYSSTSGATGGNASVSVAGQSQTITVGSNAAANWTAYSVSFTITASNPYATIEVTAARTADNFKFGIDDFTLIYDGSSYYTTILENAQSLYDSNYDWAEGADDLNAAITAATGKSTIEEKNAAIVALETAMATFKETNTVDMTAKINNPNFDSNISGWTTTGGDGNAFQRQTSAQTNFDGGFLEKWRNGWNGGYNQKNFDVYQTLSSLPNGEYTIKAAIIAVMQGDKEAFAQNKTAYTNKKHGGPYYIDDEKGVWLYGTSGETTAKAWANTKNSSFDGDGAEYKTATISVTNGSLTIGFKGIGSADGGTALGTYANWIACDNWTLSYFGFDPSTLKAQISGLKDDVQAIIDGNEVPTAVKTSLQNTLDNLVETPETKTILDAAVSALENAIAAANATKTPYAAAKALITFVTAEMNNSTGTKTGIEAAINTATTNIETRTEVADLEEDYNTLESARQTYVTSGAQPTADHVFDYTFKIADAAVTGTGWSATGTASGQQYTEAPDNRYFDCGWNTSLNKNQEVASLPAGYYTMKAATRAKASEVTSANIYVNQTRTELNRSTDNHRDGSTGGELGNGWGWTEVDFELRAAGNVTVGFYAQTTGQGWAGADDFHLYYKGNAVDDDTAEALIATVVSGKMNSTVADAQASALSTFESAQTIENYAALETAIAAASASKNAYTQLKAELDKVPGGLGTTNVYTADSYAAQYTDVLTAYTEETISTDDANAYAYGERVTGAMPAIMLSSWKVGETAALTDGSLYMNTWSTEGNSDGSEMTTPFYEYWIADANALAAKTFTATVEGLTSGTNYLVTAKVRVRQQNEQEKADDDVTIQINDGEVVNAADGTQSSVRTEMYYKTVRATGTADGEGKLAIKVVVKDGNHVSWLAFKDVHYSEVTTPTEEHKTALNNAISEAEAKTIGFEAGEYATYTNIDARKVLAAAKAIDFEVNTDYEVVAATNALTSATWTVNAVEVNAVSDELFNGTEYGAAGWTRDVTWNNVSGGSYSIPAGTMTYGDVAYHEMPLKGNTVYKLTFGHRRWDNNNADNGGQVSVLNSNNQGLDLTAYAGTSQQSLQSGDYYFRTGAAGNYTFTVTAASGRLTFGNVIIKKATDGDLLLEDTETDAPANGYYQTMSTTRTLKGGQWNGFSLPFSLTADQLAASALNGAMIKQFASADENVITMEDATAIVAGEPYLVKPTSDIENPTFDGVTVSNPEEIVEGTGDYTFQAHLYNTSLATDGSVAYVSTTDSSIKKLTSGSIKGMRAIFNIPVVNNVKALTIRFGGDADGIMTIENGQVTIDNSEIFNLAGQRVNKAQKGIYIVNGKKVLVK